MIEALWKLALLILTAVYGGKGLYLLLRWHDYARSEYWLVWAIFAVCLFHVNWRRKSGP